MLFAPETFNLAETTRAIEVAKKCKDQFSCVFMGYSLKYADLIQEAGFPFFHLKPHLTDRDIDLMMKADQMKTLRHPFTYKMVKHRVKSEVEFIQSLDPVAIVIGTTLTLFISARACQKPLIYIKPFAYTRPHLEHGTLYLPDFLQNVKLLPEALFLKVYRKIILHVRYLPKSFKKVSQQYRVKLPKYTIDMIDADYNLITNLPEVTGVTTLPRDYQYIGPVFAKLDAAIPDEIGNIERNKPIVYFAMGSSGGKDLVLKILKILTNMDVTVISPVKKLLGKSANKFSKSNNIYITDLLPAHKLSELIDLSIIHGGEGTVQTACLSGKPFIGIGLQAEQETNINDYVHFGNALKLNKKKIDQETLETMIHQLLQEKEFHEKAKEIKEILSRNDGAKNAADFLVEKFRE